MIRADVAPPAPSGILRALAAVLGRWAGRLAGPRAVSLPFEALHAASRDMAEERMCDLRHRILTRYY
jgi:hypothetical protein